MSKLFLALIDGMRPDALTALNHPFFQELCRSSRYSLDMRTVMPSVTLPCHMSLFHSVTPERHGIITNTYVPQVRPVKGLCEVLNDAGKSCASFYTWEPLRDLSRPLTLAHSTFFSGRRYTYQVADAMVTDAAEKMFAAGTEPDFVFFYQCQVDEAGHKSAWMSDEYMSALNRALDNVQKMVKLLPEDYRVILVADHGGHDRSHGSEAPEDMTIPVFMRHSTIAPGKFSGDINIIDLAPTITKILGVEADPDWEGKALL